MLKLSRRGAYVSVGSFLMVLVFTVKAAVLAPASQTSLVSPPSNQACGRCHSAIYNTYRSTAMALTSGSAADHLIVGSFFHRPSGVMYRTFLKNGKAYLGYRREEDRQLEGEQELKYYRSRISL